MITCFSSQFLLKIALFFSFFMEAGFYCRTLQCLCWDLLQKIFFGLPSFPSPQNADCHWSFIVTALCPQPHGQCLMGRQPGRLLAGGVTDGETRSVQGQPSILLENRRQELPMLRGPSTAPWLSVRWCPTCALGRRFEQTSGADLVLDVFGSCAVLQ